MRKMLLQIFVLTMISTIALAVGRKTVTPEVRYISPENDSVVDLSGKKNIIFTWKSTPIPGGGREAYKFELYKEFGYELVVNEKLDSRVFSIEVPADKFDNGMLYSWQVKQRDYKSHNWSVDQRWSFKVKK